MLKRIRNSGFILIDLIFIAYYLCNNGSLGENHAVEVIGINTLFILLFVPGLFMDKNKRKIAKLYNKFQEILWKERYFWTWLLLVTVPFLTLMNTEYLYAGKVLDLGWRKLLLGYIIVLSLVGICLLIFNNMQITLNILTIGLTIFAIGNYYVQIFRGSPIIAVDLLSFGTAMSVSSNYIYEVTWQVFRGVLTASLLIQVVHLFPFHRTMNWKLRVVFGLTWALGCGSFYPVLLKTKAFETYFVYFKYSKFNPASAYRNHGSVLIFTKSISLMKMNKPADYSDEKTEEFMQEYMEKKDSTEETSAKSLEDYPNIIVIMDEAFCDLSDGLIEFSEDPLPFYHSLEENTIKGKLYTSVYAGNTANTEFEVLTGETLAFMPEKAVAYQLYLPDHITSLSKNLTQLGYGGDIAMHPFEAKGFNRPKAYRLLGFEEFIAQEEFEDPVRIRKYISDESDFQKIIELYEDFEGNKADFGLSKEEISAEAPFFLFNVTMQNHSGYDIEGFDTPIQVVDEEQKQADLEQYINLTNLTDQALENLITYFSNTEDPTMIVFFGDHKPGLSKSYLNDYSGKEKLSDKDKLQLKYTVDYCIWTNYDIEEKANEDMSANYLGAYISDLAELPLTGYQQYLLDLKEQLPVITYYGYLDTEENYYSINDKESPYRDLILQYHNIQYNNLAGSSYEPFFFSASE